MKFKIIVAADDGSDVDYSIEYLSAADAKKFIDGWQRLQEEAAQQSVTPMQRRAEGARRRLGAGCPLDMSDGM